MRKDQFEVLMAFTYDQNSMPTKDSTHDVVKIAMLKEGWPITHDPYFVRFGDIDFFIDLGAEKVIAAEKDGEKIAIEIKTFSSPSPMTDFHAALGQFMNYRLALLHEDRERSLYLAVPLDTYESFFLLPFGQAAIHHYHLSLIVYSIAAEEVVTWIK